MLPRNPASGPEGARRRRLRARRKPAPLLLKARPGLPALLAAPGWAQDRQALLLQSPSAGHSERPRRAPGRLLSPAAQQLLLGKVGLLHTAAATGYLRALPSQAPRQAMYADPPYIFPGRSMNYYGTGHQPQQAHGRQRSGEPGTPTESASV